MSKIMICKNPDRPISHIHHDRRDYKPNKKGQFEVDDGHVDALRAHGLKLEGEPDDPVKAEQQRVDQAAEIAALKARIAELEATDKAKK
jgi:hypothetical protein